MIYSDMLLNGERPAIYFVCDRNRPGIGQIVVAVGRNMIVLRYAFRLNHVIIIGVLILIALVKILKYMLPVVVRLCDCIGLLKTGVHNVISVRRAGRTDNCRDISQRRTFSCFTGSCLVVVIQGQRSVLNIFFLLTLSHLS